MRGLVAKLGYEECGEVRGLDEADPEVFWRKVVGQRSGDSR